MSRERGRVAVDGRHVDIGAEAGVEAAFRQRHGQAAFGAVVRRPDQAGRDALDEQALQRRLAREIERRRHAANQAVHDLQIFAAAELVAARRRAARRRRRRCWNVRRTTRVGVLDQTDDAEHRRRQHAACRRSRCRG